MQRNLPVSKIMSRKLEFVAPDDLIETVRHIFEKRGFHHVPVVEHGHLIGIVSYTDYLKVIQEIFADSQDRRADEKRLLTMPVKEIMTADPICLSPEDGVEKAVQIFKTHPFHALPVIETDRKIVGILTTYDMMKVMEAWMAPEVSYNE